VLPPQKVVAVVEYGVFTSAGVCVEPLFDFKASVEIYRDANKKVAKLLGIKDEPTTTISTEKPEIGDDELDAMLSAQPGELAAAFIDDAPAGPKPKKAQSTERKVEVKD